MGISLDPFADSHPSSDLFGLARLLNPESWRCGMVWSAYLGLPLSLESTGIVLGLEKQKLTDGKELIRYFCMPCKPTAMNNQRTRNLPAYAPDKSHSRGWTLRRVSQVGTMALGLSPLSIQRQPATALTSSGVETQSSGSV